MKFPDLGGNRIKLIELNQSGLGDMYEYSKNPFLYKYFEFAPHKSIEDTKKYLHKLIERSELETAHYWFICQIKSEKIIGSFGVHDIDWRKKNAEISFGLSPDHWGKGYFNETLIIVLNYLFYEQNFHRICVTTRYDNHPSIKGLERVGFQKEGTLRNFYLHNNGKRYGAVILGLLKHEYDAQHRSK